jgi:1,4-dihydroxy-2-naphthoate octaprenyltransferase
MAKLIIRALRLPFLSASVLPFVFGSLIEKSIFNAAGFILGLVAISATHLSANLINDWADSKSGADAKDPRFFGFFGGSKLIQEKVLSERFYFNLGALFAVIAFICVIGLAFIQKSIFAVLVYFLIILLSWQYSARPLRFSYRFCGEIFIFLLFGPALVMGGYFIQAGVFPDLKSLILSLPFGFFTTAILFANEIPDYPEDKAAGKLTWVNILGQKRSYILYYLLMLAGFFSVSMAVYLKYLGLVSVASLFLIFLAGKAANILRLDYADKTKLIQSSKITIAIQALVSIILIADLII